MNWYAWGRSSLPINELVAKSFSSDGTSEAGRAASHLRCRAACKQGMHGVGLVLYLEDRIKIHCTAAGKQRNSEICAPGLGLHALPHKPDLPIVVLAVEIDAQAVQDSEPLVAR